MSDKAGEHLLAALPIYLAECRDGQDRQPVMLQLRAWVVHQCCLDQKAK